MRVSWPQTIPGDSHASERQPVPPQRIVLPQLDAAAAARDARRRRPRGRQGRRSAQARDRQGGGAQGGEADRRPRHQDEGRRGHRLRHAGGRGPHRGDARFARAADRAERRLQRHGRRGHRGDPRPPGRRSHRAQAAHHPRHRQGLGQDPLRQDQGRGRRRARGRNQHDGTRPAGRPGQANWDVNGGLDARVRARNSARMREPDWAFPSELRPRPEDWDFDLERALGALVLLRTEVPEDAFTAQILGTERVGNGIAIGDDGLILTIGYLVTEASAVWITTAHGAVLAGHALAYDQATGLGLVMPLGRLGAPALALGSAARARVGDDVVIAGHGGRAHALKAQLFDKREFAGYWEYVLDEALFAAPAHPQWGGSALIGADGKLLGIGSLLVEEKTGEQSVQGNMFVPVDILEPILEDLVQRGGERRAARPWLGMYTTETGG